MKFNPIGFLQNTIVELGLILFLIANRIYHSPLCE